MRASTYSDVTAADTVRLALQAIVDSTEFDSQLPMSVHAIPVIRVSSSPRRVRRDAPALQVPGGLVSRAWG